MTDLVQNARKSQILPVKTYLNEISQKSSGILLPIEKWLPLQNMIANHIYLSQRVIAEQAFQSIHSHSSSLKNRELIYAAIYNKKSHPQNQTLTARKKKQVFDFKTPQKQKEEFMLNTDDISTIILQKSQKNTIGKESRVDLENLLQIGTKKISNKFIVGNDQFTNKQPPYFLSKKRSRTDKSIDNQVIESSFCQNLQFDNFNVKDSSTQKKNQSLQYSQTIKISYKKNKQRQKSPIHQVFIFRQPQRKHTRPLSQDFSQRAKFIQIPVKSRNVKIIECGKTSKKQHISSQSINSKQCLNTCASTFQKTSNQKQCKYCSSLQKSQEFIKHWRNQNY